MKLLQVNQFFPLALGAKEQEVLKNGIFTNPHAGLPMTDGAQQPCSFFAHLVHLPIRWSGDQRDLPRFAALFYGNIHVLHGDLIDF